MIKAFIFLIFFLLVFLFYSYFTKKKKTSFRISIVLLFGMIAILSTAFFVLKKDNIDKLYFPPKFDGEKVIPGYFDEKINNFGTICKQIGIPITQIRKIESSLSKHDGKLFLIGGCVRNLILKKKVRDNPDLVVNLDFSILIECLNKSKIKFIDIGSKFGSVVILVGNKKFDITSTRSDINPDGRWTKIKFTKDLLEDSRRRDFTFNSIYCDTKGNIYDPNGGIQDLMNKKVRFIGDINLRIDEDYLRILRFVRFSLDISGFFEKKALGVCNHNSSKLKKLSYERRMQELEKIIMNSKIEKNEVFNELRKLMESTLESKINTNNFLRLCELEAKYNDRSFERRLKFFFRSKKYTIIYFR